MGRSLSAAIAVPPSAITSATNGDHHGRRRSADSRNTHHRDPTLGIGPPDAPLVRGGPTPSRIARYVRGLMAEGSAWSWPAPARGIITPMPEPSVNPWLSERRYRAPLLGVFIVVALCFSSTAISGATLITRSCGYDPAGTGGDVRATPNVACAKA